MIIISYDSSVRQVRLFRLVSYTLLVSATLYFVFSSIDSLPPKIDLPLSVALGILTSIIFETTIARSNVLFDTNTVGTLLAQVRDKKFDQVDLFWHKLSSWQKGTHRFLKWDETNVLQDLNLLCYVVISCDPASAEFPSYHSFKKLALSVSKRKSNSFKDFGIDITALETVFFINALYRSRYFKRDADAETDDPPQHVAENLRLLLKFATTKTEAIEDEHVKAFINATLRLKKLISFELSFDKEEQIIPIISDFLLHLQATMDFKQYSILQHHLTLQLANCIIFRKSWNHIDPDRNSKFEQMLRTHGFESIDEFRAFVENFPIRNDLFQILFSPIRNDDSIVFESFGDRILLIQRNYPDITNISILNSLAAFVETGRADHFHAGFKTLSNYWDSGAPLRSLYGDAYVLAQFLFQHLDAPNNSILIPQLIQIADSANDVFIKRCAARNAFVLSAVLSKQSLLQSIRKKFIEALPLVHPGFADHVLNNLSEGKHFFSWYELPRWYPVQIMLDATIVPHIDKELCSELILNRLDSNGG